MNKNHCCARNAKKEKIIKGKAAYGCSEWKEGCDFRIPFEMLSNDDAIKLLVNNGKVTLKGKTFELKDLLLTTNNTQNIP